MNDKYAVIFDMDGVLADTGPIHFESWVKITKELGKKYSKEDFDKDFGRQNAPILRELMGSGPSDAQITKWGDLKEEYYREMVKDKILPLPGVIELIKALKAEKFKLAVGSSGPSKNVYMFLESLKIQNYFDAIVTAAEVKNGKPAPDVFLIAAKGVKVKPENCVVIEDAPVGVEAAKRAKMKVIALTTTHKENQLTDANLIVKDLSYVQVKDIEKLLKSNLSEF